MNCEALHRTLALDDCEARPDLEAMQAHLSECDACRETHGDVALLFGLESTAPTTMSTLATAEHSGSRGPLIRRAAAAAALIVALASAGLWWESRGHKGPKAPDPAAGSVAADVNPGPILRSAAVSTYSEFSTTVSRIENGRVVTSTVSEGRRRVGP